MPNPFRVLALSLASLAASLVAAMADPPKPAAPMQAKPKQIVLISFDSAREISQWERSRALAKRTGAHFTYFLSCVFLLSPDTRTEYTAPGKGAGKSKIGFAASKQEVADRLEQIRLAAAEGHDIGSHACGHFDGKDWSKADWLAEFGAFRRIVENAYAINGISPEPPGWRDFARHAVTGFRAPYLSTDKTLYEALPGAGFEYDASGVSNGPAVPPTKNGTTRFALPLIPEGPKAKPVVAMDYNLYVRHSGGFEKPSMAGEFADRAYQAFRAAFDAQYSGKRLPLELGFHFTQMNNGAYWDALERFAGEACVKADVECISLRDYVARQRAEQKQAVAGG
ncbi:polysaccharide deacetylase [Mesorhizobium sp. M1C.F.Ca.ET.193.01.1.1]|uniref:polysaccharide deacetylase family protein n=1 Tax=unclassified Mesorhizobium TaxID=325217 RepID=UPI000FD61D89|nr:MULTISPECIES: polysaccharide deacetylase family protein [unclassified Mesorhizobium]TGS94317.1 polysaccharide deacetylase [bacterium M00.F.Ca.ET.177.01.1.1]TGQ51096.1 polysaccharide deacetylase [Mesorhizobium sp. M1C.F.Ca.ET.210.01.1.1]TGQ66580.1 polysaccharide deacetylase [Mesorhizobium sp. M1C.F.Ca.ET.212.01.1.1]TGR01075.1 polysaccharide deacetylase [Mesorhizobium sp. M1C.F.Ca.ET.204.01.1.1]TGR21694.1 polysaccharide deacetylase [Mesorhizobium sp. M1C.F.Ca.ET.196.01.1.1]